MLGPEYLHNGHKKNTIEMNGRQVFRFATQVVSESIQDALKMANLTIDDISLIVPHQANVRIIETAAKKLKVPTEKFFVNVETAANTSAASIPIALCDAVKDGRLKPDDNVVFVGFGGGLTWAASVVKWNVTPPEKSIVEREWKRARYIYARSRSKVRRVARRMGAYLAGSPTPRARLRDAERSPNGKVEE
jgi:3-oxoacyl-[acyl-carrier-protein] synthase-3